VYKNCNAFLQGGFFDLDEIWHDGYFSGKQVLREFGELWPTFSGAQIFVRILGLTFLTDCNKMWIG